MIRNILKKVDQHLRTKRAYKFFLKDWISLKDVATCASCFETMRFSRNLEPVLMAAPKARRITVIAPHGDDDIFGCGGTMVKAMALGSSVHTIYLCAGKPREAVLLEIEEVGRLIGRSHEVLDYPLGAFPFDADTLTRFRTAVERSRPDALFLPAFTDDHDEHRRVGEMLLEAFGRSKTLKGVEIWAYQVYSIVPPNVIIDITDVVETKRKASAVYRSQMASRDWVSYILGKDAFMSRFLFTGGRTAYAEGFFVLPAQEYLNVLEHYFSDPAACYYSDYYKRVNSHAKT